MQDNMMGQNIIITEQCASLRQLGRNALRGKWKTGIMAMIIYYLCLLVPTTIFDALFGVNVANIVTDDGFTYSMDAEFYQQLYNSLPQMSILSQIWIVLISGALELGAALCFLALFRGHNVRANDIFLGFERFGKALGLLVVQGIFIFLWSLLFIIPGIIAAIRYSQAFFILADDPSKGVMQCISESKSMMRGNKMKYFLLQLSFIGWMILAGLPGGILNGIVDTFAGNDIAIAIVSVITSLFVVPVTAYMYSTNAGFYEILAGHLIKETEPAPLSADQIEANAPIEKIEEVIEEVEATEEQKALEEAAHEAEEAAVHDAADAAEEIPDAEILPEPLDERDRYSE